MGPPQLPWLINVTRSVWLVGHGRCDAYHGLGAHSPLLGAYVVSLVLGRDVPWVGVVKAAEAGSVVAPD